MSWKSKLWSVTKKVGSFVGKALVLPWLINKGLDKIANKKVVGALKGVADQLLGAAATSEPVSALQQSINEVVKATVKPHLEDEMAKLRLDLNQRLDRSLSTQAADARERGKK